MKSALVLASVLVLLPAFAEDAAKPAEPGQKSSFALPQTPPYFKFPVEVFDKVRLSSTNAVVLYVRTPEEFAKGHIPGAVPQDSKAPGFVTALEKLNKKKTYLVNGANGESGAAICLQMHELGFVRVANLEGGFAAWQAAGKPVVK